MTEIYINGPIVGLMDMDGIEDYVFIFFTKLLTSFRLAESIRILPHLVFLTMLLKLLDGELTQIRAWDIGLY